MTSIIGLAGAIPILLGDNIGTTITALLASVGQSKDAKRTAVTHNSILHDIDRMGNSCVNLVDMAISGEGRGLLLDGEEANRK